MTFDEALETLGVLASEGVVVEASVWGNDPGAPPLMTGCGLLRRMEPIDARTGDWLESQDLVGEEPVLFLVGQGSDHSFSLWPSRFVSASMDDVNGIAITTQDGQLRVRRNRPWID